MCWVSPLIYILRAMADYEVALYQKLYINMVIALIEFLATVTVLC